GIERKERHALTGETINVGRRHPTPRASAINTCVSITEIIGHYQDDVWLSLLLRGCRRARHHHGSEQREQTEAGFPRHAHNLPQFSVGCLNGAGSRRPMTFAFHIWRTIDDAGADARHALVSCFRIVISLRLINTDFAGTTLFHTFG